MLLSRIRKLTSLCKKQNMGQICKWALVSCAQGPQAPPPFTQGGPLKGKKKEEIWEKLIKTGVKWEKGKEKGRGKKKRKKGQILRVLPAPNSTAVSCKGAPLASVWMRVDGRHASVSRPLCVHNYSSICEIHHILVPYVLVVPLGGHIAYIVFP